MQNEKDSQSVPWYLEDLIVGEGIVLEEFNLHDFSTEQQKYIYDACRIICFNLPGPLGLH